MERAKGSCLAEQKSKNESREVNVAKDGPSGAGENKTTTWGLPTKEKARKEDASSSGDRDVHGAMLKGVGKPAIFQMPLKTEGHLVLREGGLQRGEARFGTSPNSQKGNQMCKVNWGEGIGRERNCPGFGKRRRGGVTVIAKKKSCWSQGPL